MSATPVRSTHIVLLAGALILGALPRIDAVSRLYPPDRDQRTDVRRYYASMAESALEGRGWLPSYPTNFIPPPGQAFFIYAAKLVMPGADYQHLRSVQAVVSIVTILVAFLIGLLLRDARVGVAAAWLIALDYRLSELVGTLLPETSHVFLVFAAVAALLAALRSGRRELFAGAGFLLGAACLFKPIPTLLGPTLATLLLRRRFGGARASVVFFVSFGAAIAPWIVRNRIHYGHFLPISTNGGTLLSLANSPGLDAARPDMTYWDDLYRQPYFRDPEIEARFAGMVDGDGKLEENLKDRAYMRRTLAYMGTHPLHFVRNYAYKLRNFLLYPAGGLTESSEAPLPFRGSPRLLYTVTALGLVGVLLLIFRGSDPPATVPAVVVLYFLAFGALYHLTRDGRMNLTFRALLAIPAAYTIVFLVEGVSRWRGRLKPRDRASQVTPSDREDEQATRSA